MRNYQKKNSGFTIPEMMLTFALLIIIMALSFGDITSVLTLSREKEEETTLKEIKKAMQAFLKDKGQLPEEAGDTQGSGTTNWAEDLVSYTNLSADEMLFDAWFMPRHYRMFSQTEVFRDTSFETYYAVVYDYGADIVIDADATLGALNSGVGTSNPLNAFPNIGTDEAIYNALEAGDLLGDDNFFKITDRQTKMKNYEITSKRLSGIVGALQSYSLSQMNFAISAPEVAWETKLFYPPSVVQAPPPPSPDLAVYGNVVSADVVTFLGIGRIRTEGGTAIDDANRRNDMIDLMRILGLPDSHCCSAMELGVDDLPLPFYYYSNPRRKVGAGCDVRGSNPTLHIILPPRIVVDPAGACG